MATATAPAPAPVEVIATPKSEAKKENKRPRPNVNVIKGDGGMSFPVFNTEKDAENKEPKLGAVTVTKGADGKETETVNEANAIPCEGYRLCKVVRNSDKKEFFTWARTTDLALATVAAAEYSSEFTDAKKRGRSAKVDPVYKMFVQMLINNKQFADAKQFLAEHPQYAPHVTGLPA